MKLKILLVDNYDSFTYNLYDYFLQLDTICVVVRNDERTLEEFEQMDFDALVFSPGPQRPQDAGLLMDLMRYFYDKKPILGICLGHQAIGSFFGMHLKKAKMPMHGKTSVIEHNGHPLFNNLPSTFKVMRYHSLIVEQDKSTNLEVLARTEDKEIMALAHRDLPLYGVQFHPESILTEHGLALLNNWLTLVKPLINAPK